MIETLLYCLYTHNTLSTELTLFMLCVCIMHTLIINNTWQINAFYTSAKFNTQTWPTVTNMHHWCMDQVGDIILYVFSGQRNFSHQQEDKCIFWVASESVRASYVMVLILCLCQGWIVPTWSLIICFNCKEELFLQID